MAMRYMVPAVMVYWVNWVSKGVMGAATLASGSESVTVTVVFRGITRTGVRGEGEGQSAVPLPLRPQIYLLRGVICGCVTPGIICFRVWF